MGPGTSEENKRVWYCFYFFVRERDVNERASSDTGEAGFNSISRHAEPSGFNSRCKGAIVRLGFNCRK